MQKPRIRFNSSRKGLAITETKAADSVAPVKEVVVKKAAVKKTTAKKAPAKKAAASKGKAE
jgi:hypothetical protein